MTRHCHNCGEPWTFSGQPGRGETCLVCRADLRVAQQCRERRAEPVLEKSVRNFCEYFDFPKRAWTPKSGTDSREAAARANN
jgi:hypothetical protein